MAKRISKKPLDPSVVQRVMREMGAKGGRIGGKRRLETMTAEQRTHSAQKAAKARWKQVKTRL